MLQFLLLTASCILHTVSKLVVCWGACACLRSFMKPEAKSICLSVIRHWHITLLVLKFVFVRMTVVSIFLIFNTGRRRYSNETLHSFFLFDKSPLCYFRIHLVVR